MLVVVALSTWTCIQCKLFLIFISERHKIKLLNSIPPEEFTLRASFFFKGERSTVFSPPPRIWPNPRPTRRHHVKISFRDFQTRRTLVLTHRKKRRPWGGGENTEGKRVSSMNFFWLLITKQKDYCSYCCRMSILELTARKLKMFMLNIRLILIYTFLFKKYLTDRPNRFDPPSPKQKQILKKNKGEGGLFFGQHFRYSVYVLFCQKNDGTHFFWRTT